MNRFGDFVATVFFGFIGGCLVGCFLAFLTGWKVILESMAHGYFPVIRFVVWGGIGGMITLVGSLRKRNRSVLDP